MFRSLVAWDGQPRTISRQNYTSKKTHILPIPRKPNSVNSVHSAIGSRMNGIEFIPKTEYVPKERDHRLFRVSYSGIVPKERALSLIFRNISVTVSSKLVYSERNIFAFKKKYFDIFIIFVL